METKEAAAGKCNLAQECEENEEIVVNADPLVIPSEPQATIMFHKWMAANELGSVCSVCDRIWFLKDMSNASSKFYFFLQELFPNEDVQHFELCSTC